MKNTEKGKNKCQQTLADFIGFSDHSPYQFLDYGVFLAVSRTEPFVLVSFHVQDLVPAVASSQDLLKEMMLYGSSLRWEQERYSTFSYNLPDFVRFGQK